MKFISADLQKDIWCVTFETGFWFWKKQHRGYGKTKGRDIICTTYELSFNQESMLIDCINASDLEQAYLRRALKELEKCLE